MSEYLENLRKRVGHEYILMPSVSVSIFDDEGRMLLVLDRGSGAWVTPGGAIDPNESVSHAAIREAQEEIGVKVEPTKLLGVHGGEVVNVEYPNGDEVGYVISFLECKIIDGKPKADDNEVSRMQFVSSGGLRSLKLSSWAKEIVPKLFEAKRTGKPFFH